MEIRDIYGAIFDKKKISDPLVYMDRSRYLLVFWVYRAEIYARELFMGGALIGVS
jgi:hypothetical protein